MIGSLRGNVDEVITLGDSVCEVVIDVAGVGYRVSVTTRTAVGLGPVGSPAKLAVHTHVRDSGITLYGFDSPDERRCFEVLITTHGVGPALALAILGVHRPEVLARIVAAEDEAALTEVPGVGRRTAARLIVELGSRLDDLAGPVRMSPTSADPDARSVLAEVGEALGALGYGSEEVRPVLQALPVEGGPEELLRLALRQLAGRS